MHSVKLAMASWEGRGGGGLENVALYQDNQSTNQSIDQSMAILYFVTF